MGCNCGNKAAAPSSTWVITRADGTTYEFVGTELAARVERIKTNGKAFVAKT